MFHLIHLSIYSKEWMGNIAAVLKAVMFLGSVQAPCNNRGREARGVQAVAPGSRVSTEEMML